MLNIQIGEPGTQSIVQASGDTKQIICEVVTVSISIYQTMLQTDPALARAYRNIVSKAVAEDSPWWEEPVEGIGFCIPTISGDA